MANPKSHHTVPRLNLEHFAGHEPKGQVWTYDKITGRSTSAIPEETGTQTHFYSVQKDDGTWDTRIEGFLGTIESLAAPTYRGLLNSEIPRDNQERADFSTFLAIMYVRTPTMRRMMAEVYAKGLQIQTYATAVHKEAFENTIRRYEEDRGKKLSDGMKEKLRNDMIDPSNYILEVPKERTFRVFDIADKLAPMFFDMKWSLIIPKSGFLITSDNPVIRRVDHKTVHPVYGDHGFLNKTAEITFPLSPKLLLLLTWRKDAKTWGMVERSHIDDLNRSCAFQAERQLYSHVHHKKLEQLAQESKNSRPTMQISGFGPKKFSEVRIPRRRT